MAHDPIHPPTTGGIADQKEPKSPPPNDIDNVRAVNWLEHWTKKDDGTDKVIPFPQGLPPGEEKIQFENLITNYLNSWLDLWNAYQPVAGDPKRTLRNDHLVFKYEPADADIPLTVKITGRTNPEAKPKDQLPRGNGGNGGSGGGHLIPPEPPPPPPGSGDLG